MMEQERAGPRTSPVALVSDEALVSAVMEGERGAFAVLVERYQRGVVATCLGVLRDRQLAEDAAQDAFVAAYRKLGSLRDRGAFGGWLMRVARNRAVRVSRERARLRVTAEKRMIINDRAKTAVIRASNPFDARFMVEQAMQHMAVDQLLGPLGGRLTKVRTERVGEVVADVYESVLSNDPYRMRNEVYLDPRSGLPVKSILYLRAPDAKAETAIMTFDRIETNGPAPAKVFAFEAPQGYAVREEKEPDEPETTIVSDSAGGEVRFTMRYAFEVAGGKGILACWTLYDPKHPAEDLKLPGEAWKMILEGTKSKYAERMLRTDAAGDGRHWRWSLLTPADRSSPVEENPLAVRIEGKNASMVLATPTVRFDRHELAAMVVEAQRRTLPAGEKGVTLEEIERLVEAGK